MRTSRLSFVIAGLTVASAALSPDVSAQSRGAPVRYIISIGNHPRVDGIRLNYRDVDLELVRGANVTIWTPYDDDFSGTVKGFAVGLPMTAAENIHGIGLGLFGVGASNEIRGISISGIGTGAGGSVHGAAVGLVGVGAGSELRGIMAGGIGVGTGGSARGIMLGGIGAGAGGDMRGAAVGGIGVGVGGNARGLMVGGIGAGAGGSLGGIAIGGIGVAAGGSSRGLMIGGVGVGSGGSVTGISAGGIGVGAGGKVTGLTLAGIGVGAGGTIHGITIAGLGIGAPRLSGAAAALLVGAEMTRGVVLAPILFRTEPGGQLTGISASSVNAVRGSQHGLTIGLVNYAESLRGMQIGVVNIVRDNPRGRKVLPILNFGSGR